MIKIRFGLVGYGKVAHLHAQALIKSDNAQLVSVCGRNNIKRDSFSKKYAISSRNTISDMVRLDYVDAIIITTPHPLHCKSTLEGLVAGCHVLVEKPLATSVHDGILMIDAAKRAGKLLSVVSQRRWYPSAIRMKQAIMAGKIGTPALAQATILGWRDKAYYSSDLWRGTWEDEGGGVLINQAPHQIDLMCWFMGEAVKDVKGYIGNINHPYIEVEDTVTAAVKFENGGLGSLLFSNSQNPGMYAKVHIHGSNGKSLGVQTDGGSMFIAGSTSIQEPPYNDIWTIPEDDTYLGIWKQEDHKFFKKINPHIYFFMKQIESFANSILNGTEPEVTGNEGLQTLKIIESIYSDIPNID